MKRTVKLITQTCIAAVVIAVSGASIAQDAREIMEKNDALPEGKSFKRSAVLLIVKSGKNEKKKFESISKKYGKKRRTRMKFTYPTQMGFLSWDEPGKDSQQWIQLSSGKVRKIASSEKDKPWMNSHFFNEDIAETYIEDYKYTMAGDAVVNGVECYKIESVKKNGKKVYTKRIVYIGKKDSRMYRVDFHESGRHTKTLTLTKYETISGIPTARKLTMERTDGRGKSVLYIKDISYNVSVDDSELTREAL